MDMKAFIAGSKLVSFRFHCFLHNEYDTERPGVALLVNVFNSGFHLDPSIPFPFSMKPLCLRIGLALVAKRLEARGVDLSEARRMSREIRERQGY